MKYKKGNRCRYRPSCYTRNQITTKINSNGKQNGREIISLVDMTGVRGRPECEKSLKFY